MNFNNVVDGEEILIDTNKDFGDDDEKMATDDDWNQIAKISSRNKCEITGLKENTKYGLRARYKNQYGLIGPYSSIIKFSTS